MSILPIFFSAALLNHPDPYHFDKSAINVQIIVDAARKNDVDPFELLAIAVTESRLNENATSNTGDYGLFQVNCRVWWKDLGFSSWRECTKSMMDPNISTSAALFIIKRYRHKYERCRKFGLYSCYNGGPYWKRSKNKKRILSYRKSVYRRELIIRKRYQHLIHGILKRRYDPVRRKCLSF